MNSTDERKLRRFFTKKLVPVAEKLRGRGVRLLSVAPHHKAESWYEDGTHGEPDFAEIDPADCARMLRDMWERQDLPELAALAADLMRLAREIEFDEEQAADVSPFLYVMY